jgi:hypothetical protein
MKGNRASVREIGQPKEGCNILDLWLRERKKGCIIRGWWKKQNQKGLNYKYTNTYKHTHTHKHTQTHTHTHYTYTHTQTHTHIYTNTYIHTHIRGHYVKTQIQIVNQFLQINSLAFNKSLTVASSCAPYTLLLWLVSFSIRLPSDMNFACNLRGDPQYLNHRNIIISAVFLSNVKHNILYFKKCLVVIVAFVYIFFCIIFRTFHIQIYLKP